MKGMKVKRTFGDKIVVDGKVYVFAKKNRFSLFSGDCAGCSALISPTFGIKDEELCMSLGSCSGGVWKVTDLEPSVVGKKIFTKVVASRGTYIFDPTSTNRCKECDAFGSIDCQDIRSTCARDADPAVRQCLGTWKLPTASITQMPEPSWRKLEVETDALLSLWDAQAPYDEFKTQMEKVREARKQA